MRNLYETLLLRELYFNAQPATIVLLHNLKQYYALESRR